MAAERVPPMPYSRQVNITLPETMINELGEISSRMQRSMEQVVLIALGLLKIAFDAPKNHQRLMLTDESGKPIKEISIR
jgi:hypothetical protein